MIVVAMEAECRHAGLDPKRVERIARRIARAMAEAEEMGVFLFGGSGSGSLRYDAGDRRAPLVVATMSGMYDGGDGACHEDEDGLMRGEGE